MKYAYFYKIKTTNRPTQTGTIRAISKAQAKRLANAYAEAILTKIEYARSTVKVTEA